MRTAVLILTASVIALLFVRGAAGQVLYVVPKNDKVAKRYAKHLTTFRGMEVIIGEPKAGINCAGGVVHYINGAEAKNELWVPDPANPGFVPYKWKDGKKVKNGKRSVVSLAGNDFVSFKYVDRLQTLAGVAQDYERRVEEIDDLQRERDAQEKGSVSWFGFHGKMLAHYDRLSTWLVNMGYPKAAQKLSRTVDKEKKIVSKEATGIRERSAMESIRKIDVPPEFIEASQKVTGGRAKFSAMASQHVRMIYVSDLSDSQIERGLGLAEEVVESFRKDFVDPYRDEDFKDYIPDGHFVDFVFVPNDQKTYEMLCIALYGDQWGHDKSRERSLAMPGTHIRQRPGYIEYWRFEDNEQTDIEGIVTHRMGHNLANQHYNRGGRNMPDWLEEAVGYYVSFGHIGRNAVTCFNWNEDQYAKPAQEEGEKTVQDGLKGFFVELALNSGPKIDQLALKTLADMTDVDFGKAWSFYDFVALKKGRSGQVWLRDTCRDADDKKAFMERWRRTSERLFPVDKGVDVFHVIDEQWRKYAESEQLGG